MRYGTATLMLLLLPAGEAMAQGVSQSPTQTVTQQRRSGTTVNGGLSSAVRTNQGVSTSSGFNSPFTSPFGSSSSSQSKGGYAGSSSNR